MNKTITISKKEITSIINIAENSFRKYSKNRSTLKVYYSEKKQVFILYLDIDEKIKFETYVGLENMCNLCIHLDDCKLYEVISELEWMKYENQEAIQ